jgi:outer membrane protein
LLAADAPSEAEAGAVRSFIDKVDARKPYKFGGFVSVAPSTNINTGANAKTIYLPTTLGAANYNNDDAKKSGLGLATGLNAGFSRRIGNKWSTVLGAGVNANVYGHKRANVFSASESAEFRYLLDGGFVGVGVVGSYVNAATAGTDERTHSFSFGPRISFVKNLGLRNTLSASAVLEKRDIARSTGYDGKALLLNSALTHAIDSSFNVTLSSGIEKVMLNSGVASYDAASAALSIYKELPWGVTMDASMGYRISEYKAPYRPIQDEQKNKRFTGSVSMTKRDLNWFGFAPMVTYSYVRNKSNVTLSDYDSQAVDFRLTKDF